jgi:hypothetical protein
MSTIKADELESLILNAYKRPEARTMQQACDEQDEVRNELRKTCGEINVAVELIREVRE